MSVPQAKIDATRAKMIEALERFIASFAAQPVYCNIGEYAAITFEIAMSTDPNRPWSVAPDPEDDGSHIDLCIKTARNESW